jgi:type II secretory pathway component PulF
MNLSIDGVVSTLKKLTSKQDEDRKLYKSGLRRFRKQRVAFYEDLAEAIKDSEGVAQFLSIRIARGIRQKDPLRGVYKEMLRRYSEKGGSYSRMLQDMVPDSDVMVISSIETQGEVDKGLRFLAKVVESQAEMRATMIGALIMPALIVAMTIVYLAIMSFFVIPVFAQLAPPEKWGAVGQILYAISYVTTRFGVLLLLGLVGLVWRFSWSIPNWTGPYRSVLDRYTPYRLFCDYHSSIFLTALAALLATGEPLVRSLERLKKRSSPWLAWHIQKILMRLLAQSSQSANYGQAFDTGVFDRELSNRIIDYSRRSSNFADVIQRLGIKGVEEARKRVQNSAKVLNISLLFVMGAVVGFLLVGTTITSQSLGDGLKSEIRSPTMKR